MPGAGSSLDRNDHRLIRELISSVNRLAEAVEEMNEQLATDDSSDVSDSSTESESE